MYILQNDSQYVNILNVNTFSFSQKFNFVCVVRIFKFYSPRTFQVCLIVLLTIDTIAKLSHAQNILSYDWTLNPLT